MYPLNLSGFHDSQCLQLLSGRGMQLSGIAGSWRGILHPRGCLSPGVPVSRVPLPSRDARSRSQQLPAEGLSDTQSEARAAGTTFPWKKCGFVWLDTLRGDMAGTSTVSSGFLGPWVLPSAWNHILELRSFPSLPSLPGWK